MTNVIDIFFMILNAAKQNAPITDPLNNITHPLNNIAHPLRNISHPLRSITHPLNSINASSQDRIRELQNLLDQYFPRN